MLTVTATLDLGDKRYTTHVTRLRLTRARLPDVDRLEVDLPASVSLDAAPGDDAVLKLDGGEGEETVFTGVIRSLRGRPGLVRVVCDGAAALLAASRPVLALEGLSVGDVVKQLCDEAGVTPGDIDDGPKLALYVANGRVTALAEVARLAALTGGYARVDGEGRLDLGPEVGAERALRWGREPLDAEVTAGPPVELSAEGAGPFAAGQGEEGARWPVADFSRGGEAATSLAWRLPVRELGDVDATRAAAEAALARRAEAWQPFQLRAWLLPALSPLDRLTVQDAPERLALDAARVDHVIHHLDGSGAWTELRGAAAAGSGGLLGALGGLL
jgi:hypothetical protein